MSNSRKGYSQVTLRTTDALWDEVKHAAYEQGLTAAQLVAKVLAEYVAEGGIAQPEPEPTAPRVVQVNRQVHEQARAIAAGGNENLSEILRQRLAEQVEQVTV